MSTLRLLHLEDSPSDAFFVRSALAEAGLAVEILHATSREEFSSATQGKKFDAILLDHGVADLSCEQGIALARQNAPGTPVIIVSNSTDPRQVSASLQAGAADYVLKGQWWQLISALHRTQALADETKAHTEGERRERGTKRLLAAVQELSLVRDLPSLMAVVRRAARELTGADGATFILREGDSCFYADEEAIGPLWKGQRFPMEHCVSGWAMIHRQSLLVPDVFDDPRVPKECYEPTFVRSLVMVPIRTEKPIGAIGNYWAKKHAPAPGDVELLEALANTTAVAMESIQLYSELERRVRKRTLQLEAANQEMEAFSYSVAHDLRGPLHAIGGYADLISMKLERHVDRESMGFLEEIHSAVERMTGLIDDLLRLAKFGRADLQLEVVDLSALAAELFARIATSNPARNVDLQIEPGLQAPGDRGMLRVVFDNFLSNAWKYTARREKAVIAIGSMPLKDGQRVFFIRDNGAGFDPRFSEKLFAPFQRLHRDEDFEGTGVGLATVQRIIHRHGGLVWAESEVDRGATFYFSLPVAPDDVPL